MSARVIHLYWGMLGHFYPESYAQALSTELGMKVNYDDVIHPGNVHPMDEGNEYFPREVKKISERERIAAICITGLLDNPEYRPAVEKIRQIGEKNGIPVVMLPAEPMEEFQGHWLNKYWPKE